MMNILFVNRQVPISLKLLRSENIDLTCLSFPVQIIFIGKF